MVVAIEKPEALFEQAHSSIWKYGPMNKQMTPGYELRSSRTCGGWSLIESLIAIAMMMILTLIAIPQIVSSRRMFRMAGIPREIVSALRLARQRAMSERQAFTFQYDDVTKQICVIDHNSAGAAVLTAPNYPNTAGSFRVVVTQLTGGGVPAQEIIFGIPPPPVPPNPGVPVTANTLDDGTTFTPLVNNKLNVTFQPDGSVIDGAGNPVNRTIFIYNNKAPVDSAKAISVLGTGGRIKSWRYDDNAKKYLE
jgi:type II secretory pathway pseudopilin PulG